MAMSKGVQMMLQALGITIDPQEVEDIFRKLQKDLPAAAAYVSAQFESIGGQLREIDGKLREVETILKEYTRTRGIPVLEPDRVEKGPVNGRAKTEN